MITALVVLAIIGSVASQNCLNAIKSGGLNRVVGVKHFANQSVGIIDSHSKFMIFDSTGAMIHNETLQLPIDASTGRSRRIAAGIIGSSSELHLMSSYQYAYKYSAGKINQTFDNGNTLEVRLRVVKVISSLSNKFLALLTFGINLYQLTSSQGMNLVPGVPSALLQSPIVDFNYFSRISTTPYLDSYAIASLSKKIYVGGFVWNAVNSVWQHNRQGPAVAAATITDSTASLITGSIGLSATYLSYIS